MDLGQMPIGQRNETPRFFGADGALHQQEHRDKSC